MNASLVKKAVSILIKRGPRALITVGLDTLFPARDLALLDGRALFSDLVGLEIGGPSGAFRPLGLLPVYSWAARVDNCNFADETMWEGRIDAGETFHFSPRRPPGRQYVAEATDLSMIEGSQFDFVLSSHAIEHTANPLRALAEWRRVAKPGATFVLVVPHKDGTFDHRRPTTLLSHLIEDYECDTPETDLTHLDEILALHDFERDPGALDRAAFEARSKRNFENRSLHHHVFDTNLAAEMVTWAGLEISFIQALRPCHILLIASNPPLGRAMSPPPTVAAKSPFSSDRPLSMADPRR